MHFWTRILVRPSFPSLTLLPNTYADECLNKSVTQLFFPSPPPGSLGSRREPAFVPASRIHYLQCTIHQFDTSQYKGWPNILHLEYPIRRASDSSDDGHNLNPPWPIYHFDRHLEQLTGLGSITRRCCTGRLGFGRHLLRLRPWCKFYVYFWGKIHQLRCTSCRWLRRRHFWCGIYVMPEFRFALVTLLE